MPICWKRQLKVRLAQFLKVALAYFFQVGEELLECNYAFLNVWLYAIINTPRVSVKYRLACNCHEGHRQIKDRICLQLFTLHIHCLTNTINEVSLSSLSYKTMCWHSGSSNVMCTVNEWCLWTYLTSDHISYRWTKIFIHMCYKNVYTSKWHEYSTY